MKPTIATLLLTAMILNTLPAFGQQLQPMTYTDLSAPGATVPRNAMEINLPDGTLVEVELKTNISSEDIEEGDIIDFIVLQPVKINGATVIDRGAPAKARVMKVNKARRWGREGNFEWAMQDVVAVDGSRIPLRFSKETRGGSNGGKLAVAMAVTSLVSVAAAPFWGLKRGKHAVTPAGKRFDVFVHGDSSVTPR